MGEQLEVRSSEYRQLAERIGKKHRLTVREYIKRRVLVDGLNVTELAAEMKIDRQRLYEYARANGLRFDTVTTVRDLFAEHAAAEAGGDVTSAFGG